MTAATLPRAPRRIQANTEDPGGASSFANAVQRHDAGLVQGGVDLDRVDTTDGEKIVSNVFGQQRGQVVQQLGGTSGGAGPNIGDLLGGLLGGGRR